MTDEELAIRPSPERWPLWATIGHLACQRVFWLCDAAGRARRGDDTVPERRQYDCPGDDDLEHVLDAAALVEALASTYRIVDAFALDRWTPEMLDEVIRDDDRADDWVYSRGAGIISRVFAHDISHITELNEALGNAGLVQVVLWD